jgi:hypothetical protein
LIRLPQVAMSHRGTYSTVGAVIEGPLAVRVAAGLEPPPGAIALRVADHQQQGEQARAGPAVGLGAEADLAARADLQHGRGCLGNGLQRLRLAGPGLGAAAATRRLTTLCDQLPS